MIVTEPRCPSSVGVGQQFLTVFAPPSGQHESVPCCPSSKSSSAAEHVVLSYRPAWRIADRR